MKPIAKSAVIFFAILLGIISFYCFAGWHNVIPWAIAALLTGYLSAGRKHVILNGALFGYFLFLAYIIIGYRGNTDTASLLKFSLFAVAFSFTGAIAGIIGALTGNFVKKKLGSKPGKQDG